MKLAEALAERADCQKRIEELKMRIMQAARVQEGEKPAENPETLRAELDRLVDRFIELVQKINRKNSTHVMQTSGETLSDALARRDGLAKKREILASLAEAATIRQDRFTRSEVRFVSTVGIEDLRKEIDDLSKQYRELDTKIQEENWRVDI